MSQYKTGTVSVTNGSQVVTGTGTSWLSNIQAGDGFTVAGTQVPYTVGSVDSDGQITLSAAYAGASGSGLAYAIWRDFEEVTGAPELNHGDIETATIFTRAMRKIGQAISGIIPAHVEDPNPHSQYLLETEYQKHRLRESLLAEATLNLDFVNSRYEVYEGPVGSITQRTFNDILDFARGSAASARNATGGVSNVQTDEHRLFGNREGLLIEEQRTNLFQYSEQIEQPYWGKSNVVATANDIVAPDGTQTAARLEVTGTTGVLISRTVTFNATTLSFSCFTKKGTAATRPFLIRNATKGQNFAVGLVDYDAGTISGAGWKIEPVTDGWFFIAFSTSTGISSGDSIQTYIGSAGGSGVVGETWHVWGAQLEQGPFPSSYIKTEGSQMTRAADSCSRTLGAEWNRSEGTIFLEASALSDDEQTLSFLDNGSIRRYFYSPGSASAVFNFDGDTVLSLPIPGGKTISSSLRMAVSLKLDSRIFSLEGATAEGAHNGNLLVNAVLDFFGYTQSNKAYRRLIFIPRALTASELIALTAPEA